MSYSINKLQQNLDEVIGIANENIMQLESNSRNREFATKSTGQPIKSTKPMSSDHKLDCLAKKMRLMEERLNKAESDHEEQRNVIFALQSAQRTDKLIISKLQTVIETMRRNEMKLSTATRTKDSNLTSAIDVELIKDAVYERIKSDLHSASTEAVRICSENQSKFLSQWEAQAAVEKDLMYRGVKGPAAAALHAMESELIKLSADLERLRTHQKAQDNSCSEWREQQRMLSREVATLQGRGLAAYRAELDSVLASVAAQANEAILSVQTQARLHDQVSICKETRQLLGVQQTTLTQQLSEMDSLKTRQLSQGTLLQRLAVFVDPTTGVKCPCADWRSSAGHTQETQTTALLALQQRQQDMQAELRLLADSGKRLKTRTRDIMQQVGNITEIRQLVDSLLTEMTAKESRSRGSVSDTEKESERESERALSSSQLKSRLDSLEQISSNCTTALQALSQRVVDLQQTHQRAVLSLNPLQDALNNFQSQLTGRLHHMTAAQQQHGEVLTLLSQDLQRVNHKLVDSEPQVHDIASILLRLSQLESCSNKLTISDQNVGFEAQDSRVDSNNSSAHHQIERKRQLELQLHLKKRNHRKEFQALIAST